MLITKHARKRLKERCKVATKKQQTALIKRVLKKGLTLTNTTFNKSLAGFIKRKTEKYNLNKKIYFRLYNNIVYIFKQDIKHKTILLTVYPLPRALQKKKKKKK